MDGVIGHVHPVEIAVLPVFKHARGASQPVQVVVLELLGRLAALALHGHAVVHQLGDVAHLVVAVEQVLEVLPTLACCQGTQPPCFKLITIGCADPVAQHHAAALLKMVIGHVAQVGVALAIHHALNALQVAAVVVEMPQKLLSRPARGEKLKLVVWPPCAGRLMVSVTKLVLPR